MKTRIIKSLQDFCQPEIPDNSRGLLEEVKFSTGLSETEIQEKSGNILKNLIHNYSAFEISTIDGFTQRILRSFAKDLGLPVNFEVALNTDQILLEAVESLIARAGSDKVLTQTLLKFALSKTDEDKSWDITADLFEISKLLTNENNQIPLQLLKNKNAGDFQNFSHNLKKEIQTAREVIEQSADLFTEIMEENNLEFTDFSGKYLPEFFRKTREENYGQNFSSGWCSNLESKALYPNRISDAKKGILDNLQPYICEIFRASEKAHYHLEMLTEISKRVVQISLLNAINQQVEAIKKERNLLLISEFNPLISAQVKNQPAPFIYERLGERYTNYFIDEFQDTSRMQWENLLPLVAHSLSGNGKPTVASGLLLVGDAKQSIYRWRGGKAEQFIDLYSHSNPFNIEKKVQNLPDNYRSQGQIVEFNNAFFQFASDYLNHPDYAELFKNSRQNPKKENSGYVNISFIEAEKSEEEFEIYPEKVLEIIKNLDEKGHSRGDICILTRRKKEGISIANYLSENGISVVSSETLLLSNSPAVNFIADLLAFSLNQQDDTLKLKIFTFLEINLQLENPHLKIQKNLKFDGKDFFHWLKDLDIKFDLGEIKSLSLYEAAEYIVRSFNLIKSSDAYLQFFLDYIFQTTQKKPTGIADFLQLWETDKEKLSIAAPKEENAVQIMTIHKSKGLEFPVVIFPFANSDFKDTKRDFLWLDVPQQINEIPVSYVSASKKMLNWGERAATVFRELLDKKELDAFNVLYVACTRASEQLYLLSKMDVDRNGNENPSKVSGLLISFLKEKGKWNQEKSSYEFGEIPLQRQRERIQESKKQTKYISSPTQNKAVHILIRSGSLWDSRQQEAIEKGQIIHDILAEITTREDMLPAINKAITEGIIPKETKPAISKVIGQVISHPDLESFFVTRNSSYNEKEILIEEGKRLRPDRLNFEGKTVHILDYKTGNFKEQHAIQIKRYATTLEKMGFTAGKKILVYINKQLSLKYV